MHAFDHPGGPVRRRIIELLAGGERGAFVHDEFGISQPAVSQHLQVLRDRGFTSVRERLGRVPPVRSGCVAG